MEKYCRLTALYGVQKIFLENMNVQFLELAKDIIVCSRVNAMQIMVQFV